MKLIAYNELDVDQTLVNPWSGIHAGTGIILGILDLSPHHIWTVAIMWECVRNSHRFITLEFMWRTITPGDSYENMISDVLFIVYFSKLRKSLGKNVCDSFRYVFHIFQNI